MRNKKKEYKIKIGANLRKWRDLRGMKQKDLAEIVNLKEAAISNIENDITVPTIHQIEDLAAALEITFFQLFSDPMHKINMINNSPSSFGGIGTQQNPTDKEVLQIMMERMEKKDEQFLSSVKDMFSSMASFFKKEAS